MLKVLDLFSGIGGFSLGLERTGGFETVAFCEIEKFPQKVLNKHWPGVPIYEDVKELTAERLEADGIIRGCPGETINDVCDTKKLVSDGSNTESKISRSMRQIRQPGGADFKGIDVITGGFPCQDISVAGKQAGIRDGDRSSLFDEIIRLTRDIRPRYVISENVAALLSGSRGEWFSYVLCEFSRIGYDVEWESISAQEVGAWHKRDRVWIICYPKYSGRDAPEIRESIKERNGSNASWSNQTCEPARPGNTAGQVDRENNVPYSNSLGEPTRLGEVSEWHDHAKLVYTGKRNRAWDAEPSVCGMVDGVSDGVYEGRVTTKPTPNGQKAQKRHRIKALGNAVVPQIPELIGRAILDAEANK